MSWQGPIDVSQRDNLLDEIQWIADAYAQYPAALDQPWRDGNYPGTRSNNFSGTRKKWAQVEAAKHPPGYYRLELRLLVSCELGERFFNGPNGLRGHYYRSAYEGDRFTSDLLARCSPALVKITGALAKPRWFEGALDKSIAAGKVWVMPGPSKGNLVVPADEQANFRWTGESRKAAMDVDMLERGEKVSIGKFDEFWEHGALAFPVQTIDIKTGFVDSRGEVHIDEAKVGRATQIHHMGFV